MVAAWLGASVDSSGTRVPKRRLQAQWPLQTPRRAIDRRTESAGLTAHLRGQSQARAADERQAGSPAPRGEGRAWVMIELKRIERRIVDAGLMPDD